MIIPIQISLTSNSLVTRTIPANAQTAQERQYPHKHAIRGKSRRAGWCPSHRRINTPYSSHPADSTSLWRLLLQLILNWPVQLILDIIKDQLMTDQISSKKWVDYSDEDSSDDEHHPHPPAHPQTTSPPIPTPPKAHKIKPNKPSAAEINAELDKLDELDDARVDEVWLQMTSANRSYLEGEANYLKSKAKKGGNIVSVFPSRTPDAYDVKVYIKIAYDYIQNGYDSTDEMEIHVADRNFEPKNTQREPRRARNPEFKQKSSETDKKRYVDKETGLEPEPKKKKEETEADNDRRYTKEEAEKKGELLGNFRAKSKKEEETKLEKAESKQEAKPEPKEERKPEVKGEGEKEKAKEEKGGKQKKAKEGGKEGGKEKKGKGGSKYTFQNRFQGIQDLS